MRKIIPNKRIMIVECGALSASSSLSLSPHSTFEQRFYNGKENHDLGCSSLLSGGRRRSGKRKCGKFCGEKKGRWGTAELRTTVKGRNWSETQAAQQTKINIHMNYHNSVAVVEGERKAGKDER